MTSAPVPIPALAGLLLWAGLVPPGLAAPTPTPTPTPAQHQHQHQPHDHAPLIGPAGATYDLRWLDAMVQHHTGALRMSEVVFDIGEPGVGALAKAIWRDQAQEIQAMGQWRRAWYPDAPVPPLALRPGGDPNSLLGLARMAPAQIQAMQMSGTLPSRDTRVRWFLAGMIEHHRGAVQMADDALAKSSNATVRRLAQRILVTQGREILELRRMLQLHGSPSASLAHAKGLYKSRAEAEQRAQELGCQGTHQNQGLWMPCAHEGMLHRELRQE